MLFTERKTRDKLMNFRVTEREREKLHEVSEERGETAAKLIRRALRRELNEGKEADATNAN